MKEVQAPLIGSCIMTVHLDIPVSSQWLPEMEWHRKVSPAPLQSRSGSGGFFSVTPIKTSLKGSIGQNGFEALLEGRAGKTAPGRIPSVDNSFSELCRRRKVLFWRIWIVCSDIFNIYFPRISPYYFLYKLCRGPSVVYIVGNC